MRRVVIPLVLVALGAALAVGTAFAKSPSGTSVTASVTGTFTPSPGAETIPFTGTLTVDRFAEVDGQLALEGALASADPEGLFEPLAATVTALAAPSVDETTGGCTVAVGTANALVLRDFTLFLDGQASAFEFGEDQDLCRVLKATDKDPSDLAAVARALNKALGLG